MSLKHFKNLLVLFCFSIVFFSNAQEKQTITVKYSGNTSTDPNVKDGALVFLRDKSKQVHFIHKGADLFCDKAVYYEEAVWARAMRACPLRPPQLPSLGTAARYTASGSNIESPAMLLSVI